MINATGENLKVVVVTQTAEDWRAFATWYSVQKYLPDAAVSLLVHRTTRVEVQYYQWAKRLRVPIKFINPYYKEKVGDQLYDLKLSLSNPVLMLDYTTVLTDVLDAGWLSRLNSTTPILAMDEHAWFARLVDPKRLDDIINEYIFTGKQSPPVVVSTLISEAKDSDEPQPIVSYAKGCGRWIDTMKGCPFSNADGLVADGMTVNELRIVQLWRNMVALFSAVS